MPGSTPLAARHDLVQDALAWLSERLDRPTGEFGPSFARKTPFERNAFLGVSLPEETDIAAACRWLLGQPAEAARLPGLGARLGAALAAGHGDASGERVMGALFTLIPNGGAPGLLLVQPGAVPDPMAWIASAAARLARLAEVEPRMPLLLAIERTALDRFHANAPESRAKTLLRGGIVNVLALDGPEIGRRLEAAIPGAARTFAAPIRRLAADGASDRLMDLFLDAAANHHGPCPGNRNAVRSTTTRPAAPLNASCSSGSKRCRKRLVCSRSTPHSISRSVPGGRWRSISPRWSWRWRLRSTAITSSVTRTRTAAIAARTSISRGGASSS